MTLRKRTPIHDFWHPRVEGQIRDAIHSHPEWFSFTSEYQKRTMVNSLAKRIVGEMAAACTVAANPAGVAVNCPSTEGLGGGAKLPTDGGEVAANCVPSGARMLPVQYWPCSECRCQFLTKREALECDHTTPDRPRFKAPNWQGGAP